jgi:outer membrane protein assembly factor BamB
MEADDAGLLAFLRGMHPTHQVQKDIQALIPRLGSDSFAEREEAMRRLTALARFARPELSKASHSTDREVARRAKAILAEDTDDADRRGAALLAALRAITRRKTPGAVPPLLGAIPFCDRADLRTAAGQALAAAARPADADALRPALASPDPNVRTAAAAAYEAALGDGAREELAPLLSDRDDGVRLAAALALLNRGDRRALTALGLLLDSPDLPIRHRAGHVLRAVTGKDFHFAAYADPEVRAVAAARWRRWIAEHGPAARLALPSPPQVSRGKVLLCNPAENRVVELDESGKKVWEVTCDEPWCCEGLEDGHRLVGSASGRVDEYDAEGKRIWSLDGLGQTVKAVRRVPSGHTLVALLTKGGGSKLREFRPDKSICREVSVDLPADVQRLDDGHTLVALYCGGRVVELDRQGQVAWEVEDRKLPSSVQRLEDGNTLISYEGGDRVAELDRGGKVVWSHAIAKPTHAQRLPNGHTVIAAGEEKVVEIDAAGRVLWEYPENGVVHLSAY